MIQLVPDNLTNQRCIYLFASLLGLIMFLPFLKEIEHGRTIASGLQWLILFTAVIAIGRTTRMLIIVLCLLIPAVVFYWMATHSYDPLFFTLSRICSMGVYGVTIAALLHYVLLQSVMNADRLYGAASIYLMIGILWALLYSFLLEHNSSALNNLTMDPDAPLNTMITLIYFSFTTLTTTGYGDITPASSTAQMLVLMEQVIGTLFIAILVARLVGFYSPPASK